MGSDPFGGIMSNPDRRICSIIVVAPNPPQPVIRRDSFLQRNLAEHPGLLLIVAAHKTETVKNARRIRFGARFSSF